MSLGLLDTPVRLTWDLHGPGEALDGAAMQTVAERIAAGGVFYVTLAERPLAHPLFRELLAVLTAGGCRVQAVCAGSDRELAALDGEMPPELSLVLDATAFVTDGGLEGERFVAALQRLRRGGREPFVQLTPLRMTLHLLPHLLNICREQGAGRIRLPNARIGDRFRAFADEELPRWADLARFRQAWLEAGSPLPAGLSLEIHDRFLWEILTPDDDRARTEYGGCQAANSLAHVDHRGTVYACAAWPVPLGSLLAADLAAIWLAPARFAVRERIGATPSGCLGCRDLALCLGGCRGLGELLNAVGGGRDPLCRAPRS